MTLDYGNKFQEFMVIHQNRCWEKSKEKSKIMCLWDLNLCAQLEIETKDEKNQRQMNGNEREKIVTQKKAETCVGLNEWIFN